MPPLSNELTWKKIIVTDIESADGVQYSQEGSIVGGFSDSSLPANAALVYSWRTGFSGRSMRGRTYVPGIPQTKQETPQTITEAFRAGQAVVAEALLTRLNAASMPLVVASYVNGGAPRTTPIATPITTVLVNATLDTQRRRIKQ